MTSTTRGGRRASSPCHLLSTMLIGLALALLAASCGSDGADDAAADTVEHVTIGGIPDQDPDRLQRQFDLVADHLSERLGVDVTYEPVADYDAAVSAFRVGDLDLVWFGGLTGVQARLQVPGARAVVQRDIDAEFTSVFVASTDAGIEPIDSVEDLQVLAGRRFTFGSDSSTSGRLMPQSFLAQAGVSLDDFAGEPGFSGSHDATIELVEAGSFDAGVLNSQVWDDRVADGSADTSRVVEVFRTPPYHDYHWVAHPRLGDELIEDVQAVLLDLDVADEADAAILDLFGAERFIETTDANYAEIEAVGRDIGKIDS